MERRTDMLFHRYGTGYGTRCSRVHVPYQNVLTHGHINATSRKIPSDSGAAYIRYIDVFVYMRYVYVCMSFAFDCVGVIFKSNNYSCIFV